MDCKMIRVEIEGPAVSLDLKIVIRVEKTICWIEEHYAASRLAGE